MPTVAALRRRGPLTKVERGRSCNRESLVGEYKSYFAFASGPLKTSTFFVANSTVCWYLSLMFTAPPITPTSSEMLALQRAHELMQEMCSTSGLPEDVRNELMFCLRHYPESYMFQYDLWSPLNADVL